MLKYLLVSKIAILPLPQLPKDKADDHSAVKMVELYFASKYPIIAYPIGIMLISDNANKKYEETIIQADISTLFIEHTQ